MSAIRLALLNITEGGISGGYRKYLQAIIPHIASDARVSALMVGMPAGIDLKVPDGSRQVQRLSMGIDRFSLKRIDAVTCGAVEAFRPDVIFVPTARYFHGGDVPVMNMVRNMEPLTGNYGNPLGERLRNVIRAWEAKRSTVKADRVIAVSGYVRDYIVRKWGVADARVGVVYHGVDRNDAAAGAMPSMLDESWRGRFLFTAGSVRPARGLEDILDAWKLLKQRGTELKGVVIAGEATGGMAGYRRALQERVGKQSSEAGVIWAGLLNSGEMAWCYRNCRAFVMTSRVEACPNVVLEALVNGCVSVSVELPPMPEFFKDAALYYPAGDAEKLAEQLLRVAGMREGERAALSAAASGYAEGFSWKECAVKTVTECINAMEAGHRKPFPRSG